MLPFLKQRLAFVSNKPLATLIPSYLNPSTPLPFPLPSPQSDLIFSICPPVCLSVDLPYLVLPAGAQLSLGQADLAVAAGVHLRACPVPGPVPGDAVPAEQVAVGRPAGLLLLLLLPPDVVVVVVAVGLSEVVAVGLSEVVAVGLSEVVVGLSEAVAVALPEVVILPPDLVLPRASEALLLLAKSLISKVLPPVAPEPVLAEPAAAAAVVVVPAALGPGQADAKHDGHQQNSLQHVACHFSHASPCWLNNADFDAVVKTLLMEHFMLLLQT